MDDTSTDCCPVCWSPVADSSQWALLSQHQTSQGNIEYCLSTCGCVAILLGGDLLKTIPVAVCRRPVDSRRLSDPTPEPARYGKTGWRRRLATFRAALTATSID
ncbi:hypothetical protein AB0D04_32565 [Streptomyces sp. NPDC048483]|uniref:hypothetical protein n=1 Tax=Streptomyces sp. NPDC048483 TaxID=3154927 RepID=UPI0034194918